MAPLARLIKTRVNQNMQHHPKRKVTQIFCPSWLTNNFASWARIQSYRNCNSSARFTWAKLSGLLLLSWRICTTIYWRVRSALQQKSSVRRSRQPLKAYQRRGLIAIPNLTIKDSLASQLWKKLVRETSIHLIGSSRNRIDSSWGQSPF